MMRCLRCLMVFDCAGFGLCYLVGCLHCLRGCVVGLIYGCVSFLLAGLVGKLVGLIF